jgi:hypothetical protein
VHFGGLPDVVTTVDLDEEEITCRKFGDRNFRQSDLSTICKV